MPMLFYKYDASYEIDWDARKMEESSAKQQDPEFWKNFEETEFFPTYYISNWIGIFTSQLLDNELQTQ